MMLLGVLSDSHGHADVTGRAVRALLDEGAELLLHLGDIGTEAVLDELAGHPARIVFGNCDWNLRELARYAEGVGIEVDHPAGRIELGGRRVVFTHGHLAGVVQEALDEGVEYLLHGHTHEVRDERIGRTRVINPGALHRAARYTSALLDPVEDQLRWIPIAKDDHA
jgi:putative phosphoesterase